MTASITASPTFRVKISPCGKIDLNQTEISGYYCLVGMGMPLVAMPAVITVREMISAGWRVAMTGSASPFSLRVA